MGRFWETLEDIGWGILSIPFLPLVLLIGLFLPDDAKNIAILGPKRAGKSTLWLGLGGVKEYRPNTQGIEHISSFTITRADGTPVEISETYDIGGEDEFVSNYGMLLKEETFIYYLVDANKVSSPEYMARVRSDLVKIDKTVKQKQIPEDKIGFKFILTHYYDYTKNNPRNSEDELYRVFLNSLEKSKGRGVIGKRIDEDKYKKIMMVAELEPKYAAELGKNYIDIIKNEIGA